MKLIKMMRVAKSIKILRAGPIGEADLTCGTLAWWLNESRSQINRDLRKMEDMGLVKKQVHPYKNTSLHSWFLTEKGAEFVSSQRELL